MTSHRQLRVSEIPNVRRQQLQAQGYRCPICQQSLAHGVVALDHCHTTGQVRATICGLCNRNEGKVRKAMRFMAPKGHPVWSNPIGWLRALADYLEHHSNNPSGLIHPTFDVLKGVQRPKKKPKKKL